MKITIHQPNFLPYLGFFDKCDYADILVLYDSTQFKKNDYQNRNKIKGKDRWFWLTVPVNYKFGDTINEVKIDNSKEWKKDHLRSLETCYSGSKYFNLYFSRIKDIYEKKWNFISDFNVELIKFVLNELGIKCKVVLSSELGIKNKGTEALIEICKKLKSTKYISGRDGKKYLKIEIFKREGLAVKFQNYQHPKYNQKFGEFKPYMCILDLLFNEGPNSLKVIRDGRYYESEC